jgi:hypothetical protein
VKPHRARPSLPATRQGDFHRDKATDSRFSPWRAQLRYQ